MDDAGVTPLGSLQTKGSSMPQLAMWDDPTADQTIRPSGSADDFTSLAADAATASRTRSVVRFQQAEDGLPASVVALDCETGALARRGSIEALLPATPAKDSPSAAVGAPTATDPLRPSPPGKFIAAAMVRQASIDTAKSRRAAQPAALDGKTAQSKGDLSLVLNSDNSEDDDDDDEQEETNAAAASFWACCTSTTCCTVYSVVLGAALAALSGFFALKHDDALFVSIPLWRWIALASISVLGKILARMLYWLFQTGLGQLNRFYEYYTLSSEISASGKRWFHILIQGAATAALLHGHPEGDEAWRVAFQWVMRVFSWLLMLQSSTILIGIVSRCACQTHLL